MAQTFKPGTDNVPAGKYTEQGPRGGQVANPKTVDIKAGHRLPPTQAPGRIWSKN